MYTRSKKANKSLTSKLLIIFYASCWYFNMYFVVYFWKYDNVNRTPPPFRSFARSRDKTTNSTAQNFAGCAKL